MRTELPARRQLRWTLVLYFVLLAVLPVAVALSVALARTSAQARQQVIQQLEAIANLKARQIDSWLDSSQTSLTQMLAGSTTYDYFISAATSQENLEIVTDILTDADRATDNFNEFFYYTTNGEIVASSDPNQVGKIVAIQPYFRPSLISPYIQPPFYELSSDELTIIVTQPVTDENNVAIGVLAGRLDLTTLSSIMASNAGLGATGESYLISSESNYLLTPSRLAEYPLTRAYHSEGIERALQRQNGVETYLNYQDPPVLVIGAYRWVPELKAGLLVEQEQAEALIASAQARRLGMITALAAVVSAVAVGMMTAARIAQPLSNLTQTAQRIAGGDLAQRATVTERNEIGLLAEAFNRMATQLQDLIASLEDRVAARTRDLQVAAEVSQQVSTLLDLNELLPALVELTKSSFNLYHAHVYLLNETGDLLVMEAGAGEPGRQMKAAGHSISINAERSIVARAARTRQAVIIENTTTEPGFLPNPLLPQTRSEMAVPMVLGDRLIGVLDVQASEVGYFTQESVPVMLTLAGQVAVAVQNARAYSELRKAQEETRAALEQLERRNVFSSGIARFATTLLNRGLAGLRDALGMLGEAVRVSRVYVFENFTAADGSLACRQTHEWAAEGIASAENPHVPYDEAIPHWKQGLLSGQPVAALRSKTGAPEIAILEEQKIQSLLLLPIIIEGQMYGFVGFDDCVQERVWDQSEIELLQTASISISYAIAGARLLRQTQEALEQVEVLYQMNVALIAAQEPADILRSFVELNPTQGAYFAFLYNVHSDAAGQAKVGEMVASVTSTGEAFDLPDEVRKQISTIPITQEMLNNPHQIYTITDIAKVTDVTEETRAAMQASKVHGLTVIPLAPHGGHVIGMIALVWPEPHPLSDRERQLYEVVAPQIATVIENRQLSAETRQSEQLLRSIIDTTPDWIFAKDSQYRYLIVNESFAQFYGRRTPEEMLGKDDYDLGTPAYLIEGDPQRGIRGFRTDDREVIEGGRTIHNPFDVVNYADGTEHVFDTTKMPLRDADGNIIGVLGIARDITEQHQARRRQQTAYQLGQMLNRLLDPDELLREVVNSLATAFGYYHAHIYLLDPTRSYLVVREGLGEAGRIMKEAGHSIPLNAERSLVARAARTLEPVIVNDVTGSPGHLPNPMLPDTKSEVAVPVAIGQRLIGVIDVQQNRVRQFDQEEVQMLSTIASHLAIALTNADLFNETQRALARTEQLFQTSRSLITAQEVQQMLAGFAQPVLDKGPCQVTLYYVERNESGQPEWMEVVASLDAEGMASVSAGTRYHMPTYEPTQTLLDNPDQFVVIPDIAANETISNTTKQALAQGNVRAMMLIPLATPGSGLIGVLALNWPQPTELGSDDRDLYTVLTPQLAALVENRRLFEETRAAERAVREQEQLLRSIIDTTPDWVFAKDTNFRYIIANEAVAAQAFGLKPQDVLGKDDYELGTPAHLIEGDPERGIRGFRTDDREVIEGGRTIHNPFDVVRHIDGSEHVCETTKLPLIDAQGKVVGVLGIARDITERYHAQQREKVAQELGQQLTTLLDPDELLRTTVNSLATAFGYYHAHIYLLDPTGSYLVVREGLGEAGQIMKEAGHSIPLNAERSLVARAARTLEPVIVNDVGRNPDHLPNPLLPETRSEVAVPLVARNTLIGVLDVQHNRAQHFTDAESRMLSLVAGQIAIALSNAQLFSEIQAATEAILRLNRVVETSPAVLFRWIADEHWTVDTVSENVNQWGYTPDDFLSGRVPYGSIVYPDDLERVAQEVSQNAASGVDSFYQEYRILTKDGEVRWTSDYTTVVRDASGKITHFQGLVTDATERIKAEQTIREQQMLLRSIIDTTPDWVFAKDSQYRYLIVNESFAQFYGRRTPEEMLGKDDYELGTPAHLIEGDPQRGIRGFRTDDREVIEGGRTIHNPFDVVNYADGTEHVFDTTKLPLRDADGNIIGVLGIARDITERYHAQQREKVAQELGQQLTTLLDPNELLRTTVNSLATAFGYYHAHIYLLDPTRSYLVVREGLGEAGRIMKEAGHSIPLNAERSLVARAARTLEPVIVNDVGHNPDHLPNPLLPRTRSEVAIPLTAADKLLGVLDVQQNRSNYFTDDEIRTLTIIANQLAIALSNAQLYQEQLQTALQLRELDRLKSEFLANISHELRTPLNSIIGYSELLIDDVGAQLDEMSLEDLKAIHSSGHHLLSIINDILDLAKIEAGRMELTPAVIEVPPFVSQIVDMSRVLLKEKPDVQLLLDVPDDVPELHADPVRLRQILWNLLSNAIKFTDEGYVRLTCHTEDSWMYFSVQDTGGGIPPEYHEIIFDQFRQADGSATRKAGGTGLGLTITRQLVQLHGGDLWLESEVGKGSTFHFKLPLHVQVRPSPKAGDDGGQRATTTTNGRKPKKSAKAKAGAD